MMVSNMRNCKSLNFVFKMGLLFQNACYCICNGSCPFFPFSASKGSTSFLNSLCRVWSGDSRRHLVPRIDGSRNFVRSHLVEVDECSWRKVEVALSCRSETQHHENDSR